MITQARLQELLRYEPDTGLFWWRKPQGSAQASKPAGRISQTTGYCDIQLDGKRYKAHRLAFVYMTGKWPNGDTDHINRNRADNAWTNLRAATRRQNLANTGLRKSNTSGRAGVSWDKKNKKWVVRINLDGKRKCLGRFADIELAAAAYQAKAIELHGEFAQCRAKR